ncbi:hypothetical protein T03_13774 [Trichinella britovi]|uniref:Uncharacterized protein n=2 Tax=Trichinella TaxID=6333 RepID=A0A0V1CKE9_TRIBR|nr:hypothetical protein T05_10970 [Trichinella murrelli]KRY49780.1 hypothetical protein T03_13774 [Trichinella britovi]
MLHTFFGIPREIRNREPPGYFLLDFHYLPSRLNQPRTKHYCKKISKKLFPDYYDRRTTERTFSNMYIYSDFSIDIVLIIEKSNLKRNRNVSII